MTPDEELMERFHTLCEHMDEARAKFMLRRIAHKPLVTNINATPQQEEKPK